MKFIFVLITALVYMPALANDLKDISTYIGNSTSPSNPFVVCAVENSISEAYGNDRAVMVYSHSGPVNNDMPPEYAFITFVTQGATDGKRNIMRIELQSTDIEKKWQFVGTSSGEIYLYSTSVSPVASFKEADGTEVMKIDISNCQ